MSLGRLCGRPSCSILIVTIAILVMTGATLLHWHKDWSDQDCQLCHVRDLPTLYRVFIVVQANPPVTSHEKVSDTSAEELDAWAGSICTRAPPAARSSAA
jgi:hypothetical protein